MKIVIQRGHGYFKGVAKERDVIPTIDAHVDCHHLLIGEKMKSTECVGGQEIKIAVRENTRQGYAIAEVGDSINIEQPNSKTRRGRVGKGMAQTLTTQNEQCVIEPFAIDEQNKAIRTDGIVGTLTTDGSSPKHNNRVCDGYRIRKLTPKECFRLMDFDDEDIDKCRAVGMSDSQLYKQAGNSICVCVLEAIFGQLFYKE